jgi:hypothetical protein
MAIPSEIRELRETRRLLVRTNELATIVATHVKHRTKIDLGPFTLCAQWDNNDEIWVLTGAPELTDDDVRRETLANVFTHDVDATMGDLALAVLGDILDVKANPHNPGPYVAEFEDHAEDGSWLFIDIETTTPPPWDPHRVIVDPEMLHCPQCGYNSVHLIDNRTIHCHCGYHGKGHVVAQPLSLVLDQLNDAHATEAATVADMLETIASNDDPDMQTPEHLAACLDELVEWARQTRAKLQPNS